jgi:hypothetical protein
VEIPKWHSANQSFWPSDMCRSWGSLYELHLRLVFRHVRRRETVATAAAMALRISRRGTRGMRFNALPLLRLTCYDAAAAFGASGITTAGTAFAAFFGAAFLAAFFVAFVGAAEFSFFADAHRLR